VNKEELVPKVFIINLKISKIGYFLGVDEIGPMTARELRPVN